MTLSLGRDFWKQNTSHASSHCPPSPIPAATPHPGSRALHSWLWLPALLHLEVIAALSKVLPKNELEKSAWRLCPQQEPGTVAASIWHGEAVGKVSLWGWICSETTGACKARALEEGKFVHTRICPRALQQQLKACMLLAHITLAPTTLAPTSFHPKEAPSVVQRHLP